MSVADGIQKLLSMGLTIDQALEAAKIFEERPEGKARSTSALRQERYRDRKASQSVTSDVTRYADSERNQTVTNRNKASQSYGAPRARVEDKPFLSEIEPQQKEKKEQKESKSREELFSALTTSLDPQHAEAVIEHRKHFKGKFTPYAAKLLADKFAQCPDPNAAADEMISNGWQGFKPGWMETRANGNRGSPPLRGLAGVAQKFREDLANGKYEDVGGKEGRHPQDADDVPLLEHHN